MLVNLRRAVALSVVVIVLCLVYTFVETGIGQVFFRHQADGSLTKYGSVAIAQSWTSPKWFIGRDDSPNPLASGPTNYGPRSIQLYEQVKKQVAALAKEGITPTNGLVTGSGSGLDPEHRPRRRLCAGERGCQGQSAAGERGAQPGCRTRCRRLPRDLRVAVRQCAAAERGSREAEGLAVSTCSRHRLRRALPWIGR